MEGFLVAFALAWVGGLAIGFSVGCFVGERHPKVKHPGTADALRAEFGDPPGDQVYRPAPSNETPSPPRGGTGTMPSITRDHRVGPVPRRVSNPDKPTSRPSGPAPEPPPTPTGRV